MASDKLCSPFLRTRMLLCGVGLFSSGKKTSDKTLQLSCLMSEEGVYATQAHLLSTLSQSAGWLTHFSFGNNSAPARQYTFLLCSFLFFFFFSGTHTLYTSEILCIRKRRKIFCVCVCFCLEVARRKQHSGKILFALVRHRLAYHACLHLMHRA